MEHQSNIFLNMLRMYKKARSNKGERLDQGTGNRYILHNRGSIRDQVLHEGVDGLKSLPTPDIDESGQEQTRKLTVKSILRPRIMELLT